MKRTTAFTVCLTVLALLSLFTGLSINGNWGFLYQISFVDGPKSALLTINGKLEGFNYMLWIAVVILHIALLLAPFIYHKISHFKVWLMLIPLLFLVLQFFYWGNLMFVFIPFTVVWMVMMFTKKTDRTK